MLCPKCGNDTGNSIYCSKCNTYPFKDKDSAEWKKSLKIMLITFAICAMFTFLMLGIITINEKNQPCEVHSWQVAEIIKEATCTEDGIERKTCMDCGYTESEKIPSSHKFENEEILTKATCTEDGIAKSICSICGETKERTIYATHLFVDNECTECGRRRSVKTGNTWYVLTELDCIHFQNIDIKSAIPISNGSSFMITYYPVCKDCQICGIIDMAGVSATTPFTKTYLCNECGTMTYLKIKIEY